MRGSISTTTSWCTLGITMLLGLVGCHSRYAADEPVKSAPEACCKLADEGMKKFAGCRMTHRCRKDEPIWLRGAVSCTPVEEGNCAGGRCCELQPMYGSPDAVLNWEKSLEKNKTKAQPGDSTSPPLPATDAPTDRTPAEPDEPSSTEPPATPTP